MNRYRSEGAAGLTSRQRDHTGNWQLAPGLADSVLTVIRERYADFGPTLAYEKLREIHGIVVSKETVRQLMSEVGYWVPRRQRPAKIYQPRNRRHCIGELIQIDGSDHHWFEERGPACTLLVYIDDATSRLMYLHFTYSESTFSYFEATRAYLELHGKPQAFYSDKARANGAAFAYTIFDKLPEAGQAAIVENKRLGHVLKIVQEVQKKRDSRRGLSTPARTNIGAAPVRLKRIPGTKSARNLNMDDLVEAIGKTPFKTETIVMKPGFPGRQAKKIHHHI